MAQGGKFYDVVRKELECSICQEQFGKDNEPKVLKCLHTFCNICLEAWLRKQRKGELSCPTCRQITECPNNSINSLPSNLFYKQMVEIVEAFSRQGLEDSPHCTNCKENRRSSGRLLTVCVGRHHDEDYDDYIDDHDDYDDYQDVNNEDDWYDDNNDCYDDDDGDADWCEDTQADDYGVDEFYDDDVNNDEDQYYNDEDVNNDYNDDNYYDGDVNDGHDINNDVDWCNYDQVHDDYDNDANDHYGDSYDYYNDECDDPHDLEGDDYYEDCGE